MVTDGMYFLIVLLDQDWPVLRQQQPASDCAYADLLSCFYLFPPCSLLSFSCRLSHSLLPSYLIYSRYYLPSLPTSLPSTEVRTRKLFRTWRTYFKSPLHYQIVSWTLPSTVFPQNCYIWKLLSSTIFLNQSAETEKVVILEIFYILVSENLDRTK